MPHNTELDRRLQYGPGMRVQRWLEAAFLLASFFTGDLRPAYVTFASTVLQALSPRWALIAWIVAAYLPLSRAARRSDLYFDLRGTQGACAISVLVQGSGLWLAYTGHTSLGYLLLAVPAASFVLAPSVGFCCGCACYVLLRDGLVRLGATERYPDGARDIAVDGAQTSVGRG